MQSAAKSLWRLLSSYRSRNSFAVRHWVAP